MGRIKGFFCSFCLKRIPDQSTNDRSFSQGIDVSHLATPHVSSNQSLAHGSSSNPSSVCENTGDNDYDHYDQQSTSNNVTQNQGTPELRERRDAPDREATTSSSSPFQNHQVKSPQNPQPSPSPLNSLISQSPLSQSQQEVPSQQNYQNFNGNSSQPMQLQQLQQQQSQQPQPQQQQHHPVNNNRLGSEPGTVTTKLSYDIISVREPLAKILAERQQLQQAQQQQRLILGDHEYIEVYGERGSSCFYEEIAGSTTSSATYDQIGAPLNHNYQAIMNAYAIASRPSDSQPNERSNLNQSQNMDGQSTSNDSNATNPTDQVDHSRRSPSGNPTTSTNLQANHDNHSTSQHSSTFNGRGEAPSQSIPVYSVINKATRRSNAIIRATIDNCRPPQPPPKNLVMTHQPSTSAIQNYQPVSLVSTSRHSPQVATTSSLLSSSNNNSITDANEGTSHSHSRLPQPPPRYSKHPMYHAASRPLPLPDSSEHSINNGPAPNHRRSNDDDLESLNNGYELLNSNFDDDQIDVGYEKIRESSRYSGGSLSSQFCPLQALDNGGYESVQPIYSSPSNALAEPNYEAIGPATASELAAAATARLKAIELLKQDRTGS